METIKIKSRGIIVKLWQEFLIKQGFLHDVADGIFGPKTDVATKSFQRKYNLSADGIVGQLTYSKAKELGFQKTDDKVAPPLEPIIDSNWIPPLPDFKPLVSNAERQKTFGTYRYIINKDGNGITITDDWQKNNIVRIIIKQLIGIVGAPKDGSVYFHRIVSGQLQDLFNAWEQAGLIKFILSWEGAFVPRLVRDSKSTLSNHAFGTAFDINFKWNQRGHVPAKIGQDGCVRQLVPLANKFGFYWGGHYSLPTPPDGMHFEVAKLINS